jgi:hypothetical protein
MISFVNKEGVLIWPIIGYNFLKLMLVLFDLVTSLFFLSEVSGLNFFWLSFMLYYIGMSLEFSLSSYFFRYYSNPFKWYIILYD